MIKPFKGLYHMEWYPKTASTAFAFGDAVSLLNTAAGVGLLIPATDASTRIVGIVQQNVLVGDATTDAIPVLIGDVDAEFLFDVTTGSAAATDVGEMVDLDAAGGIDVGAYTTGQILITRVISATQVVGKINKGFGKEIPITQ